MRALVLIAALCTAAPAAAQDTFALTAQRDAELHAQADLARQRDVELTNRLSTLEARLQTDKALSDIAAMRQSPTLPAYDPKRPVAAPPPTYASIPDDKLAASNAAVRAAAANRR